MAMARNDTVWHSAEVAQRFLSGVRGSIPLAAEQIDVMLRVIAKARSDQGVRNFLDLGCGDGILGQAILAQYPEAKGVFADFSEPMLEAARQKIGVNHAFEQIDYATSAWLDAMKPFAPFDVIVSGFSIHHQPDTRKREVYQELYDLLTPGGVFLNLEHVQSIDPWVESLFDEIMIDGQYAYLSGRGDTRSRDEIAHTHYYRPDKVANILAPVDVQCQWLREIGFQHVDCYLKVFELALFGGIRA
ncbi:MAG TPA: class I SAM-dependent methyltransferase [Phototrophicaceae bacterium]|jgi:SAM-dependent methyltransferase|nr:class I SAM-dependent methyltransferase [Phototrophicaceae bacterium]